MADVNMRRSQVILRMPFDMVDVVLILDDGDRADVLLFIPPSEDIARFVGDGSAFMSVVRDTDNHMVARRAIAAVGVPKRMAPVLEDDMPIAKQKVRVKLRGGTILEGTLTYVAVPGQQPTADFLNTESPLFVLHTADAAYFVMKANVMMVVEL